MSIFDYNEHEGYRAIARYIVSYSNPSDHTYNDWIQVTKEFVERYLRDNYSHMLFRSTNLRNILEKKCVIENAHDLEIMRRQFTDEFIKRMYIANFDHKIIDLVFWAFSDKIKKTEKEREYNGTKHGDIFYSHCFGPEIVSSCDIYFHELLRDSLRLYDYVADDYVEYSEIFMILDKIFCPEDH